MVESTGAPCLVESSLIKFGDGLSTRFQEEERSTKNVVEKSSRFVECTRHKYVQLLPEKGAMSQPPGPSSFTKPT